MTSIDELDFPSGSTVLVTGATGFTGSHLLPKLAAKNITIHAIARLSSNIDRFSDLKIKWFRGDVFDPQTVREATHGVQFIIHIAAAYREAGIAEHTYELVHVKSTQLLAEEASRLPGFKRFVLVSTVGVHGHIEKPPANEDSPFNPGDTYQITKANAELWFKNYCKESGLEYSVIRPAAIYGPGDRRLLKVFKFAASKFFPVIGNGRCMYHLIHVDDLCDVLILAAIHPNAKNQVFICGNEKSSSLYEMVSIVAATLNTTPRVIKLPIWPFYLASYLCEKICPPLGIEPPIYRRRVDFFTKDRSFDTTKIRTTLNWTPRFSLEKGLRETAFWYCSKSWLKIPLSKLDPFVRGNINV